MFGSQLTPVVKNLLWANILIFLFMALFNLPLADELGLRFIAGSDFRTFQLLTYMFLHGGVHHIFSNMLGLIVFGPVLEYRFGGHRFLVFYVVCGIGAALLHQGFYLVQYITLETEIAAFMAEPTPEALIKFVESSSRIQWREVVYDFAYEIFPAQPYDADNIRQAIEIVNRYRQLVFEQFNVPMVGASGAIFGILMGFAMLYPNLQLFLLFPPIPIRAKYLVAFYGIYELISLYQQRPTDNIAHLAHLGGMLMAFLLIRMWKNKI